MMPAGSTIPSQASLAEADQAILFRLRDTARLIERMLVDERRQRYFDALSLKRSGGLSGNVTALFFGEPVVPAVSEM